MKKSLIIAVLITFGMISGSGIAGAAGGNTGAHYVDLQRMTVQEIAQEKETSLRAEHTRKTVQLFRDAAQLMQKEIAEIYSNSL